MFPIILESKKGVFTKSVYMYRYVRMFFGFGYKLILFEIQYSRRHFEKKMLIILTGLHLLSACIEHVFF